VEQGGRRSYICRIKREYEGVFICCARSGRVPPESIYIIYTLLSRVPENIKIVDPRLLSAKLLEEHSITLPQSVRDGVGLKPGDRFVIHIRHGLREIPVCVHLTPIFRVHINPDTWSIMELKVGQDIYFRLTLSLETR